MNTQTQNDKIQIPHTTIKKLISLAGKYETPDFLKADPSQFLYYYKNRADTELCAFTASLLSFGSRKQFIPKINCILEHAEKSNGIFHWIQNRDYEQFFSAEDERKFYRFYSYSDFYQLFSSLHTVLTEYKTLGAFVRSKYNDALQSLSKTGQTAAAKKINIVDVISENFSQCRIVPSTKASAKKRLCMFARWMVRDNSPVDIGLWTWFPKSELLIPMDVHVLQESQKLHILSEKEQSSRKSAEKLTDFARCVFPDDPAKLDFALFGLGVQKDSKQQLM